MNEFERQLSYPFGETLPALGSTLEVAPGVLWLRMNLPFALNHINLWLLRDEIDGVAGWSIVDCGVNNDETRAAWRTLFDTQLGGLPVLRVIVTHMHPDHMGLAHWLCERWSQPGYDGDHDHDRERECRLWISATDYHVAKQASSPADNLGGDNAAAFMASHGLSDAASLDKIRQRSSYYASMVPQIPPRYRRLMGGDTLRIGGHDWHCHAGYGHAPEHISLHAPALGVLISGDMVLPRISTNISVFDAEPEANPLPLFLDSLERLRALPADALVLPSHGKPFHGLHTRIDQLQQHHAERLADLVQACADAPQSAADVLQVLFRRVLDLHQTTFAMGESIAHLNALWLGGKLRRTRDAQGCYRFAQA